MTKNELANKVDELTAELKLKDELLAEYAKSDAEKTFLAQAVEIKDAEINKLKREVAALQQDNIKLLNNSKDVELKEIELNNNLKQELEELKVKHKCLVDEGKSTSDIVEKMNIKDAEIVKLKKELDHRETGVRNLIEEKERSLREYYAEREKNFQQYINTLEMGVQSYHDGFYSTLKGIQGQIENAVALNTILENIYTFKNKG